MSTFINFRSAIFPAIALMVITSSLILARQPDIISQPGISLGVTIDLLLFIPLAWVLLIRKTKIPKITLLPVFVLTLTLASLIIPEGHQQELTFAKTYILPILELGFLVFIIHRTTAILASVRRNLQPSNDPYEVIRTACMRVTGSKKAAEILASEAAMFYYTFAAWKPHPEAKDTFSGYKESGITAILSGVLLILLLETIWVHKYLLSLNTTLAWVVLGLSIYSGIQIFAHLKAIRSRVHTLQKGSLTLRYGLFSEVTIPYEIIEEVVLTAENPDKNSGKKLALLGELEPHNVLLKLSRPVAIQKIYGLRSMASEVYFQCDQREKFKLNLEERIKKQHT